MKTARWGMRGWVFAGLVWTMAAQAQLVLPGADRAPDVRENPPPEEFLRLPDRPSRGGSAVETPETAEAPAQTVQEDAGKAGAEEAVLHRALTPNPDLPRSLTGVHEHEPEMAQGWEVEGVVTLDALSNAAGGVSTGLALAGLGEFLGTLDGDALGWWPGGRAGLHLAYAWGDSPSARVGDFAGVSGIDAGGATGFFVWDAWLQQALPWWEARVRVGVLDFNNDFYVSDYANLFLNGGFGMGTEVSGDGTVHTYPATGPGGEALLRPFAAAYLNLGLWRGVPDTEGVLRNGDGGWFMVGEGGWRQGDSGEPGYLKLALGYWRQTNRLAHWAGEDWQAEGRSGPAFAADPKNGDSGVYVVAETAVGRRLGLFFKAGRSDPERNRYAASYVAGVHALGILPGRPEDALGLGLVRSEHSSAFLDYARGEGALYFHAETAYEITYSARIGRFFVQPDVQYVLQPGMDLAIGNAIVVGVRLQAWW